MKSGGSDILEIFSVPVNKNRKCSDQRHSGKKVEQDLFFAMFDQFTENRVKSQEYKASPYMGQQQIKP